MLLKLDDRSIILPDMPRPSSFPDTRAHILATGEQLVRHKGFTALGLTELLASAGVPKGSFYHYFDSKDVFGEALIEHYFAIYRQHLAALFADDTLGDSRARLIAYFERWLAAAECDPQLHTCLAVKLAAEVADYSEPMRVALDTAMQGIVAEIARAIGAAQADGMLDPGASAAELAEQLYARWLGASLLAKVSRSHAPLARALQATRALLA